MQVYASRKSLIKALGIPGLAEDEARTIQQTAELSFQKILEPYRDKIKYIKQRRESHSKDDRRKG